MPLSALLILLFAHTFPAVAEERELAAPFFLQELPKGANVTLPRPALTMVPVGTAVELSSTDLPQIVRLSTVPGAKGTRPEVQVKIYDTQQDQVVELVVRHPHSVVYAFKSLNSIRILSVPKDKRAAATAQLRIESNKPLGIAR